MLRHKMIDRVCCVILALTLLISALFVGAAATGKITEDTAIGYETRLFDQRRVHTIDIVMNDWDAFLKTCTSEEYAACHLVIDGESYKRQGQHIPEQRGILRQQPLLLQGGVRPLPDRPHLSRSG